MAPNIGLNKYNLYKKGTVMFTTWLVDNAQRCKADVQMGSQRGTGAGTGQSKSTYTIPMTQYIPMALTIVNSTDPKIRISSKILTLIRHTITLRKQAAEFFSGLASSVRTAEFEESNAGHRHFIYVLEEVLKILDPSADATAEDSAVEEAGNMFNALEVEEPTSEGTYPAAAPKKKPKDEVEYEPEDNDFDQAFAIFAFFENISDIRQYLQEVWADYGNGKLDIMSAAITTDTGFHQIKLSCEALAQAPAFIAMRQSSEVRQMKWEGSVDYLIACTYLAQYLGVGSEETDEMADWTCAHAHNMVRSFAQVLDPRQVPALKPDHYGVYSPEKDRDSMTRKQQDQEDLIVTMNLLPEFVKLSRARANLPAQDELTTGLRIMMDTCDAKKLPMFVGFAFQILLDIHNLLRQHVSRPFNDLQNTARNVVKTMDDYTRFSRNKHIDTWAPQNDEAFRQISDMAKDWALNDKIAKLPLPIPKGAPKMEPFYLLKNHPVLAGLLAFNFNLRLQEAGITLCNAWGSVLYPAHLYNACQKSAGMDAEWRDMEYIFGVHSSRRLFVGAPPSEASDYLKRFVYALGGGATTFARNRVAGRSLIVHSKKGPRGLKTTTPVRDIFEPRYIKGEQAVLSKGNLVAMSAVAVKAERTSPVSVDLEQLHARVASQPDLSPVQLLEVVREGIAAEELHLLFDYIGLHFRGYKLLRKLHTDLQSQLTNYFGSNYIENESELPFIVGYIFEIMFGSDRVTEALRLQHGGSRLLNTAAETLKAFLEDGINGQQSLVAAKGHSSTVLYHYFAGTMDTLAPPRE